MSKFNSSQGFRKIEESLSQKRASVHFVGAGGISMYSLLVFTAERGISVSGSDRSESDRTKKLKARGFDVRVPENLEAVEGASLIVYSLAVSENDRELRLAEEMGIPQVSRAEYLAYLSREYKMKISVSGSHGKSTATAMITRALSFCEMSPSAISGASLELDGEPYLLGARDYLVFEACEYKDSFLKFTPDISVFLNLELDHTDYFKGLDDIKRSFLSAMGRAKICVVNKDDRELSTLAESTAVPTLTYAIDADADFKAVDLSSDGGFYSFSVLKSGEIIGKITLSVLGKFSIYNALAAFAAAYTLGVPPHSIAAALSSFCGIERRIEFIGKRRCGAPVIYDYAHHPSEIRATIKAVREFYGGRLNVIFKAHTYTRTRDLFDGFVEALSLADRVYLSEIDAIREARVEGIDAAGLARAIGNGALALDDAEIISRLKNDDGAIIIMGAAPLEEIKEEILKNKI